MELRHLRYFVMAAEEANMSRAAARLNVSQPAVSRQIKDLEEELGLPLFVREPNGLSLTEGGAAALAHA
ncbi:LysR family transcriptional regulator, partial [Verrucomicrobiales bacterium]|nr:LysR family transcriptional regulator [Verrucomicrobiales bacterium]